MRSRRAANSVVGLALLTTFMSASLSGCASWSDLQFTQDDRLRFTSPPSYELAEVPVTVSWEMADFEVLERGSDGGATDDAGYFAVFVDRAPIKPGASLDDVASDDPACERDPRCPDKRYLNSLGVYPTRKTSLTLDTVAPLSGKERTQLHEVTVVLLDADGRRIGEYAWYRQFKLENVLAP